MAGSHNELLYPPEFSGNTSVSLAYCTIVPVTGIGKVSLSHAPTLSHVFHVPGLDKNLVAVSQLTKSLNCCALFFPTHCVFQDLSSGAMIRSGKERRGRYYLDTGPTQILHHAAGAKEKSDQSWSLWHKRFGHVNYHRSHSSFVYVRHSRVTWVCYISVIEKCESSFFL